jgi:hypothetical protein
MKIASASLILILAVPAGFAAAQAPDQQPPSVAEAARRTREQKKEQAKPSHTWDNDNIPTTPNGVSVVGTASAADDSAAAAPADEKNAASAPAPGSGDAAKPAGAQDLAGAKSGVDSAKENLKTLMADLDVLSRQLTLDQQQFYSKPNYSADSDGQEKLSREEAEVEVKRQQVAEAQKKVDELQAQQGPPSASPPANPN